MIYLLHAFVLIWFIINISANGLKLSEKVLLSPISLYLIYTFASTILTFEANTYYAVKALSYLLISFMLVILFDHTCRKAKINSYEVSFKLFKLGTAITLLFWLIKSEATDISIVTRYTSSTISFNVAGFYALLLFIASTVSLRSSEAKTKIDYLYIAIALSVLILGLNKNSILILIIFLIIYFTELKPNLKSVTFLLVGFTTASFISVIFYNLLEDIFLTESGIRSITTLTGRTEIWAGVLSSIKNPLLWFFGNGYGSAEPFFIYTDIFLVNFGHAHNATIQSIYETGIIGAAILNYILLYNIINGFRLTRIYGKKNITSNIFLWFNIAILIRGLTEASYAQVGSIDSYLILISYIFIKHYTPKEAHR